MICRRLYGGSGQLGLEFRSPDPRFSSGLSQGLPQACLVITTVGCGFRVSGNDVTVCVMILPHWILLWDSVGFPGASAVESICSAGDVGSILGVGRSAGQGNGNPLQ